MFRSSLVQILILIHLLGHAYSRGKVKFNVNRVDNMIIQSISLLDQLEKDVNTFSMRVRYVHFLHVPNLLAYVLEIFVLICFVIIIFSE